MAQHDELHVPDDGFAPPEAPTEPESTGRVAALRALRSLEAAQERARKQIQRETDEAKGKLVMELLPVLDNLDRTIAAAGEHGRDPAMLDGVRMVRSQLEAVLVKYGVEKIDATGQMFDPTQHEAIGLHPVHDPGANGRVAQQYEPGYAFGGRLLRPAKVMVAKYKSPQPRGSYWY